MAVLNNRKALWHVKMSHDAEVVMWLLKEMTTTISNFMKMPQTAEEVAYRLMNIFFFMFGVPFILQSDNGREFANEIIQNLADVWPGMKLVHGKSRHSQSQGFVQRSNQDVRDKLVECPIRTRKPGLEDFGLSKARNTKLCIRFSKQVLMRLRLERRRRSNFGILYSLKTCTVQTETQK